MNDIPNIADCIQQNLIQYFRDLEGEKASRVYEMVLNQVEKAMFEVVMQEACGNQSKAADILGVNRNTLRKKLLEHRLLN